MVRLRMVLVVALVAMLVSAASADTHTWDAGGAADTDWDQGLNWDQSDTVPATTDDAAFGGSTDRTVTIATGDQSIANVAVTSTAKWTFDGGNTLNVSGQFAYGSNDSSAFDGAVLGGGGQLLATNGRLYMYTAGTYSGGTTLNGGKLYVGADNALGSGTVTLTSGVICAKTKGTSYGNSYSVSNAVSLGGSISTDSTGGRGRTLTFTGNVDLTANSTIYIHSDANGSRYLSFTGDIDDGGGAFGLTKQGNGVLTLAGDNGFDGGVRVEAGMLLADHNNALGEGTLTIDGGQVHTTTGVTAGNAVVLDSDINTKGGGRNKTLEFTGPATLTGTRSFDIYRDANGSRTLKFSGPMGDGGAGYGLVKAGDDGVLTLAGDNTFSGGVDVQVNGLHIDHVNALGTGPLTIASGRSVTYDSYFDVLVSGLTLGSDTFGGGIQYDITGTYTSNESNSVDFNNFFNGAGTIMVPSPYVVPEPAGLGLLGLALLGLRRRRG